MIVAENKEHLIDLIYIDVFKKNSLKLDEIDVSNISDFSALFMRVTFDKKYGSIENWNVSNGKIFDEMFSECENIWFDFSKWDMQNAKSTSGMFQFCQDFEGKSLEHWNLKNVINCSFMFQDCENFDCDVSNWDMSNAINFESMFFGCRKFRGIGLDKWNIHIKNLKKEYEEVSFSMYSMFRYCEKLDFDISNWKFEIEGYGEFEDMFIGCHNFKGKGLDKKTFKIKRGSSNSLNYLFSACYSLQVVPKLEGEIKLISPSYFDNCYNLTSVGNNEDFKLIDTISLSSALNIKLKEFPYKPKEKSPYFNFSELSFPNISPVIYDDHIFTNRRHKVKRNNGKKLLGFHNVKIIDTKIDLKNLRLCTFYKSNEINENIKDYIFYRMKNIKLLSNSPNSICSNFDYDEKKFFNKKNIFINKNFQNKYFCWR